MSDAPPDSPRLSEADAVLLSAYLDGELDAQERAALQERLAREPALQEELEALRAGGEVLRASGAPESPAQASQAFAAFGSRLAQSAAPELPVAQARPTPWLRRALLIALAAIAGLLALNVAGRIFKRFGGPPASGWRLAWQSKPIQAIRQGRVVTVEPGQALSAGDRILLEGTETVLEGPAGLRIAERGRAALVFERGGGVFLEDGAIAVEGKQPRALNLRTPDGDVSAVESGTDGFRFIVEVKGK